MISTKVDVLVGTGHGDEGKGKVIDYLAKSYDIVARFQGGPNAGHTIQFNGLNGPVKAVLHQVPSSVFSGKLGLSGPGMVICPVEYLKEVDMILRHVPDACSRIYIAKEATVILPIHRLLDCLHEALRGNGAIGSTLKGIGPAYTDRTGRFAFSVKQLLSKDILDIVSLHQYHHRAFISYVIRNCRNEELRSSLNKMLNNLDVDLVRMLDALKLLASKVNIVSGQEFIRQALLEGKRVLAEGAQGMLLDVVYGSYPYVTSSVTTPVGAALGLMISDKQLGQRIGVFKAYCTRVGKGPLPTEFHREEELNGNYNQKRHPIAHYIQSKGNEFGSTTGRPRRCGWLDLPALRRSVEVGGLDGLVMTMVDVFDGLDSVKVCVGYEGSQLGDPSLAKPIFREIPWGVGSARDVRRFVDLPKHVQAYVELIEKYVGVPILMISTGPDRESIIVLSPEGERTGEALLQIGTGY